MDGSTIGYAFVGTMCNDLNSIGLIQDTRRSVESTGGIAAHELGHIFNMDHDDGSECFFYCTIVFCAYGFIFISMLINSMQKLVNNSILPVV